VDDQKQTWTPGQMRDALKERARLDPGAPGTIGLPPQTPQTVVNVTQQAITPTPKGADVLAALLCVPCPGLGQLVQGRFWAACGFFFGSAIVTLLTLGFGAPIIWIWAIVDAARH
jgi:hypothetical protein